MIIFEGIVTRVAVLIIENFQRWLHNIKPLNIQVSN